MSCPYVVQTDKLGDALAISRADIAPPADPRLIRAQLARWIADVRSVYVDVAAERDAGERRLCDGRSQWRRRPDAQRLVLAQ